MDFRPRHVQCCLQEGVYGSRLGRPIKKRASSANRRMDSVMELLGHPEFESLNPMLLRLADGILRLLCFQLRTAAGMGRRGKVSVPARRVHRVYRRVASVCLVAASPFLGVLSTCNGTQAGLTLSEDLAHAYLCCSCLGCATEGLSKEGARSGLRRTLQS
eukprot:scaffold1504_cov417-Prasinococcus_capsulatus_cf.AAC.5